MAKNKGLVIAIIIFFIILAFLGFFIASLSSGEEKQEFKAPLTGAYHYPLLVGYSEDKPPQQEQSFYNYYAQPSYSKYICSYNAYDCSDFGGDRAKAQEVYEYCLRKTGRDVHWLDADNDGRACEWG